MYEKIKEAAEYIQRILPFAPKVGMVLGSGLQPLAEEIQDAILISYDQVPHMPHATAPGHIGQFVCGYVEGQAVICMQGRLHGYEGHAPQDIVFPIRVMRAMGVQVLILTNAAGGINTSFTVGDFMLIEDQINFTGKSPLIGPNDEAIGPRFNDMTFAFAPELQEKAKKAAQSCGIPLKQGVYIGVNGPQFETPAEIRAFRTLGADAVGMSTVFEVIAAAHCGLPVLAISMITNMAAGVKMQALSGAEVNQTAEQRSQDFRKLVREIIKML